MTKVMRRRVPRIVVPNFLRVGIPYEIPMLDIVQGIDVRQRQVDFLAVQMLVLQRVPALKTDVVIVQITKEGSLKKIRILVFGITVYDCIHLFLASRPYGSVIETGIRVAVNERIAVTFLEAGFRGVLDASMLHII